MFYLTYRFGVWLTGSSGISRPVEVTVHWFLDQLQQIWVPLIVGSVFVGAAFALLGMIAADCAWRFYVIRKHRRRNKRRANRKRVAFEL